MPRLAAALVLTALGVAHAQSGSFIIPTIREDGGTDFAYWDLFGPGSGQPNYNHPNPPALLDGLGRDDDENPTTAFGNRTTLIQTGTNTAFITSSGAIYSFAAPLAIEVPYEAPSEKPGEITNVIYQGLLGGARLNVNSVFLRYEDSGGQTVDLPPVYKGMDDPQTGAFSERIVCAFQWNLTGLNLREFTIVYTTPDSMPLWQSQLDVVVGEPFEQELGYLLATRSRPITRFARPGKVDTNVPEDFDDRFFFQGEQLNLIADPEAGWQATGWYYNGAAPPGATLPLTFPAQDTTVTALFAPLSFDVWRIYHFYHANGLLGSEDDYLDDLISAPEVDPDEDGLSNAGEYVFAGDAYTSDQIRTRPQMLLVEEAGQMHPAIRYRSNGLPAGMGDVVQTVRIAADGGAWTDNGQAAVTVEVSRALQPDGSALVTVRTAQPLSAFDSLAMQVAWSVGGVPGTPLEPAPLALITDPVLAAAQQGTQYQVELQAEAGLAPYTWSLLSGMLPSGLTLASDGALSGMPEVGGSFVFTLQVEDALGAQLTREFSVEIAPYAISTNAQLGSTSVDVPYEQALAVVGGTGPFEWMVTAGSLPPGLNLSSAGVLSGTPTVSGAFSFAVQVVDDNDLTTSLVFQLDVVDMTIVSPGNLPVAVVNRPYQFALAVSGGQAPFTWSLQSGTLPSWLDLAANGVLTGTPTQLSLPVSFVVRVQDNGGIAVTRSFNLQVVSTLPPPVLPPLVFPDLQVGAEAALTVQAFSYPERFVVSGLPKGLRLNPKTGEISGRPSVAGVFVVQAQAFNSAGASASVTGTMLVRTLPGSLVGTFTALSGRGAVNGELGSLISLKTTATGAFTVSVKTGKSAKSAKGYLNVGAPQVLVEVAGGLLSLDIDAVTGEVTGDHGGAAVEGWRAVWDKNLNPASGREGYYSMAIELATADDALPQGVGFATFTVPANGLLKLAGKTADGQAMVSSGPLGPNGEIAVYAPQHANKGSVLGVCELAEDADGVFSDNEISGALSWQKPATKGRTYAAAFGPVELEVTGRYLAQSSKGQVVLGLPDLGEFDAEFAEGGIGESATVADVEGMEWTEKFAVVMPAAGNAAGLKLKINKSTGAVSGTFTLKETAPPLTRKNVKVAGQIVRTADDETRAVGYFLLPQMPQGSEKASQTPILSGAVYLVQPLP